MLKKILFLFFLFFFFPQYTFAVTTSITNYPSTISSEPFLIDVSIVGAASGVNYLRADLYKEGTTNYFGETYNNTSWYGGSDGLMYFPITIVSGATASASIQARIGTPTSSEFSGPGSYKLKIRRYTSSGNAASSDLQVPKDVQINFSTPTPTPTPAPGPTSSSTSTPKPSTPKPTSTPAPTSLTVSLNKNLDKDISSSGVLSQSTISPKLEIETSLPSPDSKKIIVASENKAPKLIAGLGIMLIIISSIVFIRRFKYGQSSNNE